MLNKLFEDDEQEEIKERKIILLIDFSAVSNSTHRVQLNDPTISSQDELLELWRHTLLTSIIKRKKIINPDEIVLAIDSKSWRKKEFKYYKYKRDLDKAKSDIDFEFFYKASDQLVNEIKEHFPWIVIKEKGCEGDDIIGILSIELSKDNDIVIMSSDKDLRQLTVHDNVKFYSYRDNEFKEKVDKEYIIRHILMGDKSDGIPNVKSQDNSFVAGIRLKSLGPKTCDKILIEGLDEFLDKNNLRNNYERNKKLIELSSNTIPEDLWKKVLTQYKNYVKLKPDYVSMLHFFHKNKLRSLKERIDEFY